MRLQIAQLDEFLVAHRALEELRRIRMYQHVYVQVIPSLKLSAAAVAVERQIAVLRIVLDLDHPVRVLFVDRPPLRLLRFACDGLFGARQPLQHLVRHHVLHFVHRCVRIGDGGGRFDFVRALVRAQRARLVELLRARVAFVRPKVEMGALVRLQAAQLAKVLGAQVARVRLFVGVDAIVRLQVALLAECFEANGALEGGGLFVVVPFHVDHEAIVVDERLLANAALVLLRHGDDVGGGAGRVDAGQRRILLLHNVVRYDGRGLGGLSRGGGRGCRRHNMLILVRIDRIQFDIVDVVLDEIRGDRSDLLVVGKEVQCAAVVFDNQVHFGGASARPTPRLLLRAETLQRRPAVGVAAHSCVVGCHLVRDVSCTSPRRATAPIETIINEYEYAKSKEKRIRNDICMHVLFV